ncbi:hypothetical protein SAMN05216419_100228 [Nitrosomonas cryotolerans]|uniref:UPF0246 protein SAMN02743940_0818 n=1 Tax=Nitrosomonas cryotolerans ATCC 49181 TaxID=1131553 RepID=A0A1N6GQQ2_9PROT|nr:peroxide stress protein YaaA [Nitrosomonas cryotolerans]SFP39757.1 hypothetical protein SAMN05216419_100228 [Nitrosomonas cryotolerans]SIO09807.1 hypothetical protein SAMN02743940_0818 [Nitrosomonas cryotolerans ATCC 49181]
MIIVISPAKTLDFETPPAIKEHTLPVFLDCSSELIQQLRRLEPDELGRLMSISSKLATLNSNRYHEWSLPFNMDNAKQSIFAFKGDVYTGLEAASLNTVDIKFAQEHLRILSGLYGVLRPLDLIQAYRLEMGTSFKNNRGSNLYEFWGHRITESLNQNLKNEQNPTVINLASNEYFKSIKTDQLNARIITPIFKDNKNGTYKIISFFAKKARGLMSRYIIQHQLTDPEDIKAFDYSGYHFNKHTSTDNEWIFTREDIKMNHSNLH